MKANRGIDGKIGWNLYTSLYIYMYNEGSCDLYEKVKELKLKISRVAVLYFIEEGNFG